VNSIGRICRLKLTRYSGIKGGIAGGIAMVIPALIYGLIAEHSIWYPVNLFGRCRRR